VTSLTWVFRLRRIVRLTATKPTIKNPRFRHRLEEFRIAEDNEGVLETAALPRKPESDTLPDVAERNAGDVFRLQPSCLRRNCHHRRIGLRQSCLRRKFRLSTETLCWKSRLGLKDFLRGRGGRRRLQIGLRCSCQLGTLANWRLEGPKGSGSSAPPSSILRQRRSQDFSITA
jgi:hypothetical protein